jgi:SAM-dependent methyltransferase
MVELSGCPACDGNSNRRWCTKFGLQLVQCEGCGLVYANPRLSPEEIWQRYSPDYFWKEYLPSLGVHDGRFDLAYFDARHAPMLRLIAKHAPQRGRLLEIGTGAGFFLKAAERAGWGVAGVEVSREAVGFASARLNLDVRQEPSETMALSAEAFDVAVMFDVIEHLLDPVLSLQRVRAALRPGGLLVVSTPNVNALTRFALGADWAVLSPAEHLFNFSASSLDRVLRRAGFSDVTLERKYEGFGVFETMNPRYTHAPSTLRNKAYNALVSTVGRVVFRRVQRAGLADSLIALASVC